jgi:hypothetical protein
VRSCRDSFLVGLHGSTKENLNRGYRVVRLRGREARSAKPEDFINGFLDGKKINGRPVDVLNMETIRSCSLTTMRELSITSIRNSFPGFGFRVSTSPKKRNRQDAEAAEINELLSCDELQVSCDLLLGALCDWVPWR